MGYQEGMDDLEEYLVGVRVRIQTSDFIFQNEATRLLTMGEESEDSVQYQSLERVVQDEKLILPGGERRKSGLQTDHGTRI